MRQRTRDYNGVPCSRGRNDTADALQRLDDERHERSHASTKPKLSVRAATARQHVARAAHEQRVARPARDKTHSLTRRQRHRRRQPAIARVAHSEGASKAAAKRRKGAVTANRTTVNDADFN